MLTTLDAIVGRLADAYEPDRVILFGSRARGAAPDDADVDRLVVKDTNRRPLDRRIDVERILADRAVSLDLREALAQCAGLTPAAPERQAVLGHCLRQTLLVRPTGC